MISNLLHSGRPPATRKSSLVSVQHQPERIRSRTTRQSPPPSSRHGYKLLQNVQCIATVFSPNAHYIPTTANRLSDAMGQTFSSGLKQAVFLPKPLFTVDDIPDLSGKVIIVTGGNAGIGKETIKVRMASCLPYIIQVLTSIHQALLAKNAKVYLAARNKSKADKAISELKQSTGKEAIFLELDLANLKSIKESAETFLR